MTFSRLSTGLVLAFVLAAITPAAAQSRGAAHTFDGVWSVLIITEQGDCDRGYRYAVRIRQGRISHANPERSTFNINGRVTRSGDVKVSVVRGDQRADGRGRMTRNAGSGKWRSASGKCSGVWSAERRAGDGDLTLMEGVGDHVSAMLWVAATPFRIIAGDAEERRRQRD
jgi:hypothetical protein